MGKEYFCNPVNVPYRYQFNKPQVQGMSGDACEVQLCPWLQVW